MEGFCDSNRFKIGGNGQLCHHRSGSTWADKVIDGVDFDKTIQWENSGYAYVEEDKGDEIVGNRKISGEVLETTKEWTKGKGKKKLSHKKNSKKHSTKPKPKNSWHKRISKVARQLDMEDIGSHTEQIADGEWNDFWEEKRIEEEEKEKAYWDSWAQEVEKNPGHYAVISVKILVDPDGVSVHDIDAAGVNRGNRRLQGTDTDVPPGFSFYQYDFFTYWDEVNQMYIWKDMSKDSWYCGGWRDHFDYYPDIKKLEEIFSLDKQFLPWKEVGTLSRWINGIEWNTVWSRMDEIRTGVMYGRECEYIGGDDFMNRSRSANYYAKTQIPRMVFT